MVTSRPMTRDATTAASIARLWEASSGCGRSAEPARRAGGVVGDVAAADHDDAPADLDREAQVDVREQIDGGEHARQLGAGDLERPALAAAGREEDGVEVSRQVLEGDGAADGRTEADLDAQPADEVDLPLELRARQAVLGDPEAHHAAGDGAPRRRPPRGGP